MELKLNSEMFLIPDGETYLVYAPRRHYVMRLAPRDVNLLARLNRNQPMPGDAESDLVQALSKAGIVNGDPEPNPPNATGTPFAPVRATILLTNRCNLACKYCYAAGKDRDMVMDERLGQAAIDYVAKNCSLRKKKLLEIGFHGGGEATMAWPQLTALCDYAKGVADKNNLQLRMGIATNGCLTAKKAAWIAAHFANVNLSLDGPPRIQDRMRPTRSGGPSSGMIRETMRCLEKAGTPYGIQATITKDTMPEMSEMVRYFARHVKPRLVKFEPVSDCGRFQGHRDHIPPAHEFARCFNQAFEVGRKLGLHVAFSGIRLLGPRLAYFCGAFGEPFAVTPDGYVTACFEAFCSTAPYAETFLFGRWNKESEEFVLDMRKLERLRKRNVHNLKPCARCFCKYSCAGDCATRSFRYSGTRELTMVGARCEAIREITRYQLSGFVDHVGKQFVKEGRGNAK